MSTGTSIQPRSAADIPRLQRMARTLRRHMLTMAAGKGQGYIGQGLGFADILAALYFHEMKYDPLNPSWEDRDRFILSTGHYSIALWAALVEIGVLPAGELAQYGADGSRLEMSTLDSTPGVEMTGGSLGHGLGQGVGMAMGSRLAGKSSRVFVELSDGELQEGSTWEAAMAAAHFKLDGLVAIIDCNGIQADGPMVLNVEPVAEKWEAFGWRTTEIDGNDMAQVIAALDEARRVADQPKAIVARTMPGKGVPSIERCERAHFLNVSHIDWANALRELEAPHG
jgi:transketolase